MKKQNIPKTNHYVPQFLLKNFSIAGNEKQIWVYDKLKENKFKTNIKNVACENHFYNFNIQNVIVSIEPVLSNFETKASMAINKITEQKNLSCLSEEDRIVLSYFFSLQFVRTKQHRIFYEELLRSMKQKIKALGYDSEKMEEFKHTDTDYAKRFGIKSIMKCKKFVPYFFHKSWLLFESPKQLPIYISDNPIALQNIYDFSPYGNLGLGVKGIEIYCPLTSQLTLAMYCLSFEEEVKKTLNQFKMLSSMAPHFTHSISEPIYLKKIARCLKSGEATNFDSEMVLNQNSLQVSFSSRFVYSSTDDFSVVERMLNDNVNYKKSLKIKFN
jgi:hypothetical protein